MPRATNVVALFKDEDRYIFLFDDDSPTALLKVFGEFAANKELNFSWYDAAVLSQKVRRLQRERESQLEDTPPSATPRFGQGTD